MRRSSPCALALASVLVAAALAGCTSAPTPAPADDPPAFDAGGPAWSFTDTTGATHTRDAPAANATVLFFMATWCGSCRHTAPTLATVHGDYEDDGARFYSLSWDPSETAEDLDRWRAELAQDWPHGADPGLAMARAFGVTSQSSVVLLDEDGHLVKRWGYGQVTEAALRGALDEALAS